MRLLRLVEAVDLVDEQNRLSSHLESLPASTTTSRTAWNPFGDGRKGRNRDRLYWAINLPRVVFRSRRPQNTSS